MQCGGAVAQHSPVSPRLRRPGTFLPVLSPQHTSVLSPPHTFQTTKKRIDDHAEQTNNKDHHAASTHMVSNSGCPRVLQEEKEQERKGQQPSQQDETQRQPCVDVRSLLIVISLLRQASEEEARTLVAMLAARGLFCSLLQAVRVAARVCGDGLDARSCVCQCACTPCVCVYVRVLPAVQ